MSSQTQIHFEQQGSELLAVEIGHSSLSPVIGSLHRALFALGVNVCSYRALAGGTGLVERIVLERHDGARIDGALSARAKAAILPIALQPHTAAVG